jgi:tryptophan synthase alpha chain
VSLRLLREKLKDGAHHLSPFLVLGDPTPGLSIDLAKTAVEAGAGMLEIGFPYGDPVADGPAIQAADERALGAGTSTEKAIEILSRVHAACPDTPLNLLVYGNLVHARGYEKFCRDVVEAGASTLLVPDISLEESPALRKASRKARLGHVELVGPLTSVKRLQKIDRAADAFLYLVAHQGVTGVRADSFQPVADLVQRILSQVHNPLCLGFGLSRPEHIRGAFQAGARIAVVGSHLARVIGRAWTEPSAHREENVLERFEEALKRLVGSDQDKPKENRNAGHHE